jgi:signal peptidase
VKGDLLRRLVKEVISVIIVIVLLVPAVIYVAPFLVGGSFSSVVMGGSMEPTIHVGSIVVVRRVNPEGVKVGDVIAFRTGESKTIHRVIEKVVEGGSFYFRTKGDANEDPDPWIVKPQDVLGELQLTIPYYGYLIWFAQTPFGIVLFILVPAIILIANEVRNILKLRKGVKG